MPDNLLYPTGIRSFDAHLGGGLPVSANLLLYGEPLTGKKPFMMQFIYEGLRMNIPGIFVLTDFSFEEWKELMYQSGWNISRYEENGLLQVVDCHSRQFDPSLEDSGIVTYVDSPSDLPAISLQVSGLQDEIAKISESHRLGFHSVSSLLEGAPQESVYRFMQFVTGRFRRAGATAMYAMEKGMHDERDFTMVEHLMDGLIEFEGDKLRVKGLMGTPQDWKKYEITDSGVQIKGGKGKE